MAGNDIEKNIEYSASFNPFSMIEFGTFDVSFP
jgi:hypothetical protein